MQLTAVAHATAPVWEWKMSGKSPRMPQQHPEPDYITNHPQNINLCEKVLHSLYVIKSKFVADKVSAHSKKYMT